MLSPRIRSRAAIIAAFGLAACAGGDTITQPHTPAALTALPRQLSPAEQSVLSAANAFSFSLWRQLNTASRDSNIFVSPLSASFSLGMAMNGAAGRTFTDMRAGLGFDSIPAARIDSGYKHLIALLTSLDPSVTTQIANSIWYDKSFPFNQQFLNEDADYFGATIKGLDFRDGSASLSAINGWVSSNTNGRIPSIVDQIDPGNVMFLINAIYFKGSWRERFDPARTHDATFHGVTGDASVRLMHRESVMPYTETPSYQAVELPYGDSAFSMVVVLPKPGVGIDSLAAGFTADAWQSLTRSLHPSGITLDLPKFTTSWKRELIPDLQALGMEAPFMAGGADFTRMSPAGGNLYVSSVLQKAWVNVDEEGTEAAAVTSTTITVTSACLCTPMRVDRPFLFFIRERLSGTIMFMGKIVDLR